MLHSRIAPRRGPLTIWALAAAFVAVPLHLAKAADAAPCQLRRVAGFDMHFNAAGLPSVPLTVAGQQRPFLLGNNDRYSSLFDSEVKAMSIKTGRDPRIPSRLDGKDNVAAVKDFKIGALPVPNYNFGVEPDDVNAPDETGALGVDILNLFDVDLDFGKGKLNLIQPNACGSAVVYWGGPFSQIPLKVFTTNGLGGLGEQYFHPIYIDGKLDGVETHILIDIRMPRSFIYFPQANRMFGWNGVPDGAKKVEPLRPPGYKKDEDTYFYPFKTLDMSGLVINNPKIALWNQPGPGVANNIVFIGMDVLRLLHLYVAYDKSMLYVSPAAPPAAPAQSNAQPAQ